MVLAGMQRQLTDGTRDMTSTDLSGLRQRIRDLREGLGLSQRELAKLAGVHHSCVSRAESGARETTVKTIGALACALGVRLVVTLQGVADVPTGMLESGHGK